MLLRQLVIIIIAALIQFYSYGQQNFSSVSLRIRNAKNAIGISDSADRIAYIFEGHKQYQLAILDSVGKEIKNIIINKSYKRKKETIIGGVLSEDHFLSFFYNKKQNILSSLVVDLSTDKYEFHDLKEIPSNENFLRAFTMNGKFYFLTVPKQKNILNVYSTDGLQVATSTFGIEMTTFYASLNSNNELLNELPESSVGIETIRTRLDNNIKSAYPKKKLYYENNKIYLSFDDPQATHLVIIDLEQSKSFYKKLNFSLEEGNNSSSKNGNSFLYDNKIFRTTISPEMMNISIIDLDSIKLINNFNIYPDKEIDFSNGPIVQEGGTSSISTDERILHRTKQYFNRVLVGNISIAANRIDSGRIELEVGSYEEIITRTSPSFGAPTFSFGMGMGMGFGTMGPGFYNPYSPFSRGFYGYPGYYPYNSPTTRIRMVSFKSLLKDPYYDHVKGEVPETLREKIKSYLENNIKHEMPELHTITSLNEKKLMMGWYRKSKNKFEIVSFERINKTIN